MLTTVKEDLLYSFSGLCIWLLDSYRAATHDYPHRKLCRSSGRCASRCIASLYFLHPAKTVCVTYSTPRPFSMYASYRAHSTVIGHTPEDFRRAGECYRAAPTSSFLQELRVNTELYETIRMSLLKMAIFEIQPHVLLCALPQLDEKNTYCYYIYAVRLTQLDWKLYISSLYAHYNVTQTTAFVQLLTQNKHR